MKKSVLLLLLAVFSLALVGCGSTNNTYTPPKTNAGSVSLAFASQNENAQAKQALKTALKLFQEQRYVEAEQAFWSLDNAYSSDNYAWNIRVVSAALTCQLAQGELHRFMNDVSKLRSYTKGVSNLPRQTQVLLSMADSIGNTSKVNASNAYIDTRISNWFNAIQE